MNWEARKALESQSKQVRQGMQIAAGVSHLETWGTDEMYLVSCLPVCLFAHGTSWLITPRHSSTCLQLYGMAL